MVLTVTLLGVIISVHFVNLQSLISAQDTVFEIDAVVSVEGWTPPFSQSDFSFGPAYLWIKGDDQWFGPSQVLDGGITSERIKVDTGISTLDFYLSSSREPPTNQRRLFQGNWGITGQGKPEPGISYVAEGKVAFNNPDDDSDGIPSLDEAFLRWHTEINDRFILISSDPFEPDTDFDGIPDGLEIRGTNAWACRTNPRQEDSDSDRLTDVQETHANPCQSDTDDDGLQDGDEVLRYETTPVKKDTDGDGLKDGDEVLRTRPTP